ncbi:DUF1801 domain-containing protein [bacterium]|nr:DUF1801 domain-containing protein [bacterium]
MAKKIKLKTQKNKLSVAAYIAGIKDPELKKNCKTLLSVFKKATGLKPKMWGPAIIGFGEFTYYRSNGDEGTFLETGFSARKSGPVLYIVAGYEKYAALLKNLGPHKKSKSCLYLKNLEDTNLKVLGKLISQGLKDNRKQAKERKIKLSKS